MKNIYLTLAMILPSYKSIAIIHSKTGALHVSEKLAYQETVKTRGLISRLKKSWDLILYSIVNGHIVARGARI